MLKQRRSVCGSSASSPVHCVKHGTLAIAGLLSGLLLFAWCDSVRAAAQSKPNIVVILVDDMGYSDLGCYGSEIPTPSLDALAAGGLRFTQFYNTARCCPTRAALLTGLYSHQTGVGHMTNDKGSPGYQGRLNDQCVTFAEVLKPAGYFTAMTGKWHVGQNFGVTPWGRGFDRSLNAAAGGFYFADDNRAELFLNGEKLPKADARLPKDWYSTDLWTTFGLKFIDESITAKKPFFLYLAHNAPHFPLQAPAADIAKFRGRYKAGWDALRQQRHARQLQLGIVDRAWPPAPRPNEIKAWSELPAEEQDRFDHLMATYSACVFRMDQAIGDLVAGLKQRGVLDNTLILFMSDNGGNAEAGPNGRTRGDDPSQADSDWFCGESWAFLENTPFRRYKHFNHEGGIASPLIAHWPAGIRAKGELRHQPGHLIDIMATCVDVAGATYPREFNAKPIRPLEGKSLLPAFTNQPIERDALYWEHEGNAAIRVGDWKLVRLGKAGAWELYDLKADRTEQTDLAAKHPEQVKTLSAKWEAWAMRSQVLPYPGNYDLRDANSKAVKGSAALRFELKPNADLKDGDAPAIANQGFTVTATLDRPGSSGVIVAQGGANLGWSLFFESGTLHFLVNREGTRSEVTSNDPVLATAKVITATLGPKGLAKLTVDGRELARKKLPGSIPAQPIDGLQVGRDLAGAVGNYSAPFPFNGNVTGVTLQIDK